MSAPGASPSRSDITRQLMDEGCSGALAPTLAELQRRGGPCAESELVERRALIMTWLDAVAKNSEHGRLLAVDRLNKDPAPDQVLALALSLTLDLMRLQSGLSPDEITHQDLASELSASNRFWPICPRTSSEHAAVHGNGSSC